MSLMSPPRGLIQTPTTLQCTTDLPVLKLCFSIKHKIKLCIFVFIKCVSDAINVVKELS